MRHDNFLIVDFTPANLSNGNANLDYEKEVEKLRKQYEEEYLSKCQVQADLHSLKMRYEEEIAKLNQMEMKTVIERVIT